MELNEVMLILKEMGSPQKVKSYKKQGVHNELFGVSIANLKKILKQTKKDHELAIKLWNTDNFDARMLATYLADPNKLTLELANVWVQSIEYYVLSETLSSLVTKSPKWREIMNSWIESDKEFVKSTGYYVFSDVLRVNKTISTKEIKEQLSIIETRIHTESNRVKHTMNNALMAIWIFRPKFQEQVLIIAKKIGKVEVDHGKTSCITPDATKYILKTITRNKSHKKNK